MSQTAAGLLASGAARELGQEVGGGLVAGMVARVRPVFGSNARSVSAGLDAYTAGRDQTVVWSRTGQ